VGRVRAAGRGAGRGRKDGPRAKTGRGQSAGRGPRSGPRAERTGRGPTSGPRAKVHRHKRHVAARHASTKRDSVCINSGQRRAMRRMVRRSSRRPSSGQALRRGGAARVTACAPTAANGVSDAARCGAAAVGIRAAKTAQRPLAFKRPSPEARRRNTRDSVCNISGERRERCGTVRRSGRWHSSSQDLRRGGAAA
jgi:hypothetical protein